MKYINEIEFHKSAIEKERLIEERSLLVQSRINELEEIIEAGYSDVKCPSCFNFVSKLLDRMRYYAPAIWENPEDWGQKRGANGEYLAKPDELSL